MAEPNRIVWLIAADDAAGKEAQRLLRRAKALHVEQVRPQSSVEQYAALAADPRTGAMLIEYSLAGATPAPYDGVALANYMRVLRPDLPIFVLTDAFDALMDQGGAVFDGIITQEQFRAHPHVYATQLLRSVQRFDAALTARQQRFRMLLDRQGAGTLTPPETDELGVLQASMERPLNLALAAHADRAEENLGQQQAMVRELRRIADKLGDL